MCHFGREKKKQCRSHRNFIEFWQIIVKANGKKKEKKNNNKQTNKQKISR